MPTPENSEVPNPTIELRKKIARQLCSSILWIDEEIFPYNVKNGEKIYDYSHFHNLFQPVTQQFQEEGYLVHLHPFEQSTQEDGFDDEFAEDSPSLANAKFLCTKADIIILDWHLGDGAGTKNSIEILKSLLDSPATRFVIILSNYSDDFENELKDKGLHSVEKFSRISSSNHWKSRNGIHLTLLNKKPDGIHPITAKEIISAVFDLISSTYPDYLHWAALEIASRLKTQIPEWLHNLPFSTDSAILQELLSLESEVRSHLPENLFEDLIEVAKAKNLEGLLPENSMVNDWPNRERDLHGDTQALTVQHSERVKQVIRLESCASGLDKKLISQCTKAVPDSQWERSHIAFTEFCENISLKELPSTPSPGSIYRTSEDKEGEIYICASQACDCARSSLLLLVKATREDEAKKDSTSFQFSRESYRVDAKAENLFTVAVEKVSRELTGFKKIGQLRPAIAARIISRFWTGTTRPAANLTNFARAQRKAE